MCIFNQILDASDKSLRQILLYQLPGSCFTVDIHCFIVFFFVAFKKNYWCTCYKYKQYQIFKCISRCNFFAFKILIAIHWLGECNGLFIDCFIVSKMYCYLWLHFFKNCIIYQNLLVVLLSYTSLHLVWQFVVLFVWVQHIVQP